MSNWKKSGENQWDLDDKVRVVFEPDHKEQPAWGGWYKVYSLEGETPKMWGMKRHLSYAKFYAEKVARGEIEEE